MKAIAKILVPVAFAFGAIGAASAQTLLIETDYPGQAPYAAATSTPSQNELAVIQFNEGAPVDNPAFEQKRVTRSRAEVQSDATIAVPYGPAMNA